MISAIKPLINKLYKLDGDIESIAGYEDQNFKLTTSDGDFVIKLSKEDQRENIEMQSRVMEALRGSDLKIFPSLILSESGNSYETVIIKDIQWILRVIPWLEGELFASSDKSKELFIDFGRVLGKMDICLSDSQLWSKRKEPYVWDLQYAGLSKKSLVHIKNPADRRVSAYFLQQFTWFVQPQMEGFRKAMIHSDANDYNLLVKDQQISGIFDFGDAVYAPIINELGIALAYALMGQTDLLETTRQIVEGFHSEFPLKEEEIDVLYYLIAARLSVTVCQAAYSRYKSPKNDYLQVSEKPAIDLLHKWIKINPHYFSEKIKLHLGLTRQSKTDLQEFKNHRSTHVNPSLSISFSEPIKMVNAAFQYMYAEDGTTYLDCVNNICHVGHNHPDVVEAGSSQMAKLNTNTRYLYDSLNEYATKLTSLFPEPLEVAFFVNSGSEAGDLAQRIARTVTGKKDMVVVDHAYHGNTLAGLEASPYKYESTGGLGKANHIHKMPSPDSYTNDEIQANQFADDFRQLVENTDGIAAFYSETIVGCGGQVVLPEGYLKGIYREARDIGAICIADEIQVGFGRVGDAFWAFELQDVVPDIVVVGKPIGNGHPMAALITTKEIAEKFNTGMEFFSSFGGNPVSCEIGKAVLSVIEKEHLQEHARQVGNYFKTELKKLQGKYSIIKDVRGYGLFLGVELVNEGKPATDITKSLIEFMKQNGVLLSSDGPANNVIKIKPPMTFDKSNVDEVVSKMDGYLTKL